MSKPILLFIIHLGGILSNGRMNFLNSLLQCLTVVTWNIKVVATTRAIIRVSRIAQGECSAVVGTIVLRFAVILIGRLKYNLASFNLVHVCAHYSILVCPHFFQFVWNLVKCFKTIDVICRLVITTFKRFSLGRFLNFQKARCKFQKVIQLNFIWSNSMLWYLCYWDTGASRRTEHSGFFYLPITDNFKRSMKSLQLACLKLIGVYTKDLCL